MIQLIEKGRRSRSRRSAEGGDQEDPGAPATPHPRADLEQWKQGLIAEFESTLSRRRMARGLECVAGIHLASFVLCQVIYVPQGPADLRHPLLWLLELLAILGCLRSTLGRGWIRSSTAINLVAKLWISFLILSFNVVSLNALAGFEQPWFRPVWGTLSSFLFASLAWLFSPLFLIPAVQMWATGLLMANLTDWGFLIYGVSWALALLGIAWWLRRADRAREASGTLRAR